MPWSAWVALLAAAVIVGLFVATRVARVFGRPRDRRPGYITDTRRSHRAAVDDGPTVRAIKNIVGERVTAPTEDNHG